MRLLCPIIIAGSVLIATAATTETVDYIEAIVGDTVITHGQVVEASLPAMDVLRRDPFASSQELFERKEKILADGLKQLVENQLILQDFASSGNKMPDNILDEEVERRIKKRFGDRMTMTRTLKSMGMTPEMYRKRVHDDIILEYMKMKNVSSAILISPQKIEQYYKTNQAKYQLGEEVKLRMVVLPRRESRTSEELRATAQEIIMKVDQGVPFAEMASIYSEGSTRGQKGDWEWRETKKLAKGFADAAAELKVGQHSPVLGQARDPKASGTYWVYQYDSKGRTLLARRYSEAGEKLQEIRCEPEKDPPNVILPTPEAFYVMYVEDRRPARTRPMTEMRDEMEGELKRQEQERLHQKWMERLSKKTFVAKFVR
jgi:parvulin-like peptidyl-prolyl isomerase